MMTWQLNERTDIVFSAPECKQTWASGDETNHCYNWAEESGQNVNSDHNMDTEGGMIVLNQDS